MDEGNQRKNISFSWEVMAVFYLSLFSRTAASVNQSGNACPMALKLIACVLLLEITTFLRECYRTLPKPSKLVRYAQPAVDPSSGRSGYFQWSESRAASRDHPPSSAGPSTAGVTGGMVAVAATAGSGGGGAVAPSAAATAGGASGGGGGPVAGVAVAPPGASSTGRRWSMAAQSIAGN